jgi:flavin-dependent dehydrogenase
MRALLARLAEGGGSDVMTELNRLTYPRLQIPVGQAMKCTDFAAKAIETRELRGKKEAAAAAAKRQREAELRKQHLASVLQRAEIIWSGLDPLMDQKIASAYDQAAAQLQELRDAYAEAGDSDGFQQKLNGFRLRYSNRPAMLRRIEKL